MTPCCEFEYGLLLYNRLTPRREEVAQYHHDPDGLADYLRHLSLSKRLGCVLSLIRQSEASHDNKEALLSLPRDLAGDVIEELRQVSWPLAGFKLLMDLYFIISFVN